MQSILIMSALALEGGAGALGFAPLEIYKADDNACCLKTIDVNGDGLRDIAYVNNDKAVIEFLVQKGAEELARDLARPPEVDPRKPNDIPSDRRFRRETYLTEKRVFCWDFVDVTGDGEEDLVFYGDPRELVVVTGAADGGWGEPRTWRITSGVASTQALATGDFDGDTRTDVALLGKNETTFWFGREGGLGEPIDVPNTVRGAYGIVAGDYDGDGREDLLFVGPGDEPLQVRFQGPDGLGPTYGFALAGPRDWAIDDVDGDGRTDVAFIDDVTGHLKLYGFELRTANDRVLGGPRVFPLADDDDTKHRRHAVADVDGDGRVDVLVTQPAAARVNLFLQSADGTFASPRSFPTLSKVTFLTVVDLEGDGSHEVVVLSPDERSIGVARWTEHGLSLPEAIPVEGKPLAFGAADLTGNGAADWVVVTKDGRTQRLLIHTGGVERALADGIGPEGEHVLSLVLEGVKDSPETVALFDADRDGRTDVLLLFDYEPMKVFLNRPGEDGAALALVDVSAATSFGRGLVEKVVPGSFHAADYDGDGLFEILLAKENFARAVRIGRPPGSDDGSEQSRVVVIEQFLAKSPRAQITGVAALNLDQDPEREIVLFDKKEHELSVLDRRDGTYTVIDTINVPRISFSGFRVADLDSDGREDLYLAGENEFVVFFTGSECWTLVARTSYVTDVKDGRLNRIALGDLDGGSLELFVIDMSEQLLKILSLEHGVLEQRMSFRVFEAKAFQRKQNLDEPREMTVDDVTGDGLPDIVSLAHDRVLVYPREGEGR